MIYNVLNGWAVMDVLVFPFKIFHYVVKKSVRWVIVEGQKNWIFYVEGFFLLQNFIFKTEFFLIIIFYSICNKIQIWIFKNLFSSIPFPSFVYYLSNIYKHSESMTWKTSNWIEFNFCIWELLISILWRTKKKFFFVQSGRIFQTFMFIVIDIRE